MICVPPYSGTVIYDFVPDDPGEQGCKSGEIITITNNEKPDWLYFENSSGQKGWIPSKFIQCENQSKNTSQQSTNNEAIKKMQELGKSKIVRKINEQKAAIVNRIGNFLYVPLKEIIDRECTQVPTFFWNATNFIENKAIKQEGIYRLSADKSEVEKLRERLEKDPDMPIPVNTDNNVVATLVKRFLQFMPVPLIPSDFYQSVLDLDAEKEEKEKVYNLINLISQFPREHINLLVVFLKHIKVMMKHTATTNMGIKNLCTIFSPCVFRKEEEEGGSIALSDLTAMNSMMMLLVSHTNTIVGAFGFPRVSIFADFVGPSEYAVPFNSEFDVETPSSAHSDVIQFPLPPAAKPHVRKKS